METGQQEVSTPTEEAGPEVSHWLHHRAITYFSAVQSVRANVFHAVTLLLLLEPIKCLLKILKNLCCTLHVHWLTVTFNPLL